MNEPLKEKKSQVAIGVLTGVTAVVGGIEPASALPMTEQFFANFNVTVSDGAPGNQSGVYLDIASDSQQISLFDDLGGTRILTQVDIVVETSSAELSANADGSCSSFFCGVSSNNQTEFLFFDEVSGMNYVNSPQAFGVTASDTCFNIEPGFCFLQDVQSIDPSVLDMTLEVTNPADLLNFVGGGGFAVTPRLVLSGNYNANTDDEGIVQEFAAEADSNWEGTVSVTYEYEHVPEPGTFLLFGAGLAGLSLAQRRRKRA